MREPQSTFRVGVIGGGPAGLIAAEALAEAGLGVDVFERMPTVGRKFLIAGRGGLNLTHSEPIEGFLKRYQDPTGMIARAVRATPPSALRAWVQGLGQDTFIGSSGRVFPNTMKASPLLRAWIYRLERTGVRIFTRHAWQNFQHGQVAQFETPTGQAEHQRDAWVLALGGGSWRKLGTDGSWRGVLERLGIRTLDFAPSNAGVRMNWSAHMLAHAGAPIKNISARIADVQVRGEILVSRYGLEGGPIYALSPSIRAILGAGQGHLEIDLKADVPESGLARQLAKARGKRSLSSHIERNANLSKPAIALAREACGGPLPDDPDVLAHTLKHVRLPIRGHAPLDDAISTVGGIDLQAVDDDFMLRNLPGVFVAGEMLDWDAPTGGYLIQGCFSTGIAAAHGVLKWLNHHPARAPPRAISHILIE